MFKLLAKTNKLLLPSFSKQSLDPARLTTWQKALLAWRYFVTTRALSK